MKSGLVAEGVDTTVISSSGGGGGGGGGCKQICGFCSDLFTALINHLNIDDKNLQPQNFARLKLQDDPGGSRRILQSLHHKYQLVDDSSQKD